MVSQATAQPEPSMTLSKGQLPCEMCGKLIDKHLFPFHIDKGITLEQAWPHPVCADCQKEAEAERMRRLKDEYDRNHDKLEAEEKIGWLFDSGIPGHFTSSTFANFKRDLQPTAFKAVQEYNWAYADEGGTSLVLYSPNLFGVGKTHLLSALAKKVIDETEAIRADRYYRVVKQDSPVIMTTETVFISRLRATFKPDSPEAESDVYADLQNHQLLILDDVGKVRPRDLSFLQSVYFHIVDQRYNDGAPMVIATNLGLAELEAHIGGASADRLREMCGKKGFIRMTGKSFRR